MTAGGAAAVLGKALGDCTPRVRRRRLARAFGRGRRALAVPAW